MKRSLAANPSLGRFVRKTSIFVFPALLIMASVPAARAGDGESWVFRRSYFSHVLPPDVQVHYPIPVSRSAYRLPLVEVYPGFGVRGVQRYNPIMIYDGRSTDVTIYRQFWVQLQP